ncbi:MAG: V-type ATP synthase subunit E family protein [Candidatus Thorarchaeota archaeon]
MIFISEEAELKEKVGLLGFFMIDQAQREIKEINRTTLFQKAEIRKNFEDRKRKQSEKLKENFIEQYNEILNSFLTSTLSESREKLLSLKIELINNLKISLKNHIKDSINERYENYVDFILKSIQKISSNIDKPGEIILYFNSRDYNYFNKNIGSIKNILKNPVIVEKANEEHIGGFKVTITKANISYDYTIDSLLISNYVDIEIEFSKLITDLKYKELNDEFENYVNLKKKEIKNYLKNYD